MAEKKRAVKAQERDEELVDFLAPAGGSGQELLVAVNGETIRIRPGAAVKIRRKFLKVLEAAARQAECARRYMDGMAR